MKTIIAGTRDFWDYDYLLNTICECPWFITQVISGGATGVDEMAIRFAKDHNVEYNIYYAPWNDLTLKPCKIKINKKGNTYNALAGFIRNQWMVNVADALIAINVNNSPGTNDIIRRAQNCNLPVYVRSLSL